MGNHFYHQYTCEFESRSSRGVLDTIVCDNVLSMTCGRSVVFIENTTNKTDRHDITEIVLKVALNMISLFILIE
jgi:hypothetical protein